MKKHPATLALLASLLLGGCSGLGQSHATRTPEEAVAAAAAARWNAAIAGDWKTAYSHATPAYRAAVSLDAFTARTQGGAIIRKKVEIPQVTCQDDVCTALVRMTYRPTAPGFGDLTTDFNERWIKEDGQWHIYLPF